MSAQYGGQQQAPQWYNSPTMQALQNFQQTDYVQPQYGGQQQQWGEETQNAGPGIRHLVDNDHRKVTPVLDYTVGIVPPEDQSVTAQNYRSRQLLYPEPKAKHYYPVGTYMSKPSYLLPNPEPKSTHDTMFQTNLPAPPSCIRAGSARRAGSGGHQYKPSSPSWSQNANNAPSPQNQTGQYQNGSSYARPQWVGGSGGSGGSRSPTNRSMSGASSPQQSVSRMVQWPPASPTGSSSQQQQQQPTSNGGGGYNIQTPSWQRPNLNSGPAAYDIEVANPDPSSRVVHMQFNSPMGMYSAQNVADSLHGQTGLNPTVRKAGDFRQSPTYQAVMNQGGGASNM